MSMTPNQNYTANIVYVPVKNPVRLLAFTSLLLASLALGCTRELVSESLESFGNPVECSDTDSTPPSAELVFPHPITGKTIRLKAGDPNMTIPINPTDRFFVTALAEDPEGVKKITIFSPSRPECESVDRIGCKVFTTMLPNTLQVNTAMTRLWLPQLVEVTAGCPQQCKLVSWRKSVYAKSTNCIGTEITTPMVIFTVHYP